MELLRQRLAEECARQQLEGRGPTPATQRFLRRVANQELLLRPGAGGATDLAAALDALGGALGECLALPRRWLTLDLPGQPAPVGLGAYRTAALALNSLWFPLWAGAASARAALFPAGAGWLLCVTGEGCTRSPQGSALAQPWTDGALTLAALQAVAAQGGGTCVLSLREGSLTAAVRLPQAGRAGAFYSARDLIWDRFGPVHLFLAGYTILPE